MIYIISSGKAAALGLDKKDSWCEITPQIPKGGAITIDDQVYLDITGLAPGELKKKTGQLKKSCAGSFLGIIDPKGGAEDPGAFFFEGFRDYISQNLVKKGLTKKRFAAALLYANEGKSPDQGKTSPGAGIGGSNRSNGSGEEVKIKRKTAKLPAGKFEGWRSIRTGTSSHFFFLFVSISGKSDLVSLTRDDAFSAIKNRLRELLQQNLREAEALLWMDTDDNSLFLIPPAAAQCKAAVEASLKMIMNSRLIGFERLGLAMPVDFTIALHYGETIFQAPGKTGAVISEAVNYIFHLGAKKAEAGRLTISGEVPEEVIPKGLADLFDSAGVYEGIPISHSKRFTLADPLR